MRKNFPDNFRNLERDFKNFHQYFPREKKIKHTGFLGTPTYFGLAFFTIIIIPRYADHAWLDYKIHK